MRKAGGVLASIFTFLVTLSLVLGASFCLLLSAPPTIVFANLFSTEQGTGMTHAEVVEVAKNVRAYCVGESETVLPWGAYDTPTTLGNDSRLHLNDVRAVFHWAMLFTAICGGLTVVSIVAHLICRCRKRLGTVFVAAALVAILAALAVAACAVFNFDAAFTALHTVFFTGDSWLFPGDCLLICALPENYWIAMGALWIALIILFGTIVWMVGRLLRRKS